MRALPILLLLTVAAAARGEDFHELSDRAQCRLSFGNSVRHLAYETALRVEICHRDRMYGKIANGIDCNDPSSWQGSGYTDGAKSFGRDVARYDAEAAECSQGVSTTTEVGYVSCPAPCDAMPVTSFPQLGECLKCVTAASAHDTLVALMGTPPAPSTKVPRKCQEMIGRVIVRYMNKRMNLQHGCQFLKEIEDPQYVGLDCGDIDTPGHPKAVRSARAREKLRDQIDRRCDAVDFAAQLDTCGSDAASETPCILDTLDQWTSTLLNAIYPAY